MRRLNRKRALKVVKEFDAFSKVPEDYQKKSVRGGSFSLVTFSLIAFLVVSELIYYSRTTYKYEYAVDSDLNTKLDINVDITIAMPCEALGADVLDLAGETTHTDDLKSEKTLFELSQEQRSWLKAKRSIMEKMSEYRSLNDLIMLESTSMPQSKTEGIRLGSCRLHGTITTNKVAGNFHITIGKHVQDPLQRSAHRHLGSMVPAELYNLSHRIDHFSFGVHVPGALNPLDATLQVTDVRNYMYQYFIQVVPSEYVSFWSTVKTNQYSTTERQRPVTTGKGGVGVPGIFFKYDISPMMVKITVARRPFWKFIVRLCGIIGGIFATSGMIHTFIGLVSEYVRSRKGDRVSNHSGSTQPQKFSSLQDQESSSPPPSASYSTQSAPNNTGSPVEYTQNMSQQFPHTTGDTVTQMDNPVIS
jgi:hypothetical protein